MAVTITLDSIVDARGVSSPAASIAPPAASVPPAAIA